MAEPNLTEAAKQSWTNMVDLTIAGTLDSAIAAFCEAVLAVFPTPTAKAHPVLNWTAVLFGYQEQMGGAANDYVELRISADYVYRLCYMAAQSQDQSLISATEAAAILAAYNANFP